MASNDLVFVDYFTFDRFVEDEDFSYIKCKVIGSETSVFFTTTDLIASAGSLPPLEKDDEIQVAFTARRTDGLRKEIVSLKAVSVKECERTVEHLYPAIFRCNSVSIGGADWSNAYFDFLLEDGTIVPFVVRYNNWEVMKQANGDAFSGYLNAGKRYNISIRVIKTKFFWDWNTRELIPLPKKNGYDQYKPVLKLEKIESA